VKLSVKSDYAARAVLGLALHYPRQVALTMDQVAEEQGLPPKYLPQILLELKAKGVVRSVRGKAGGYLLARPPAEITLGDVLRAVDGPLFDAPGLGNSGGPPELRRAWQKLRQAVEDTVNAITFQQLLEEAAKKQQMYYI
jgi:Rrf2 family protein